MLGVPLVALALLQSPASLPTPPDVIVVVLDDVGHSDVRSVPLPTLGKLAAEGTSFDRAYSMPVCSPARRSLLFGEYSGEDAGDGCTSSPLEAPSPALVSLPEVLETAGYRTALFGKWHLGSNPIGPWTSAPMVHGFHSWRAGVPKNVSSCGGSDYWRWLRVDDGFARISNEYQTEAVRDEFLAWWTSTPAPRFACVAFQAAHAPTSTPPASLLPPGYVVGSSARARFEAVLVAADVALGEMLAAVDPRSTYVFVVGDNGTAPAAVATGQSPSKVKGTTFEGGIHVPLVVSGPDVRRGRTTESLAHGVDLMATIAALAGARIPPGAARDSRSLLPVLRGEPVPPREFVICDNSPGANHNDAIVTARWKLRRAGALVEELYDLVLDPLEEHPLDPRDPTLPEATRAVAQALIQALDAYEAR